MNVRIVRGQRINRVWYEAGDVAVFDDRSAKWLIEQRIAEPVDAAEVPMAPTPPRAPPARPRFAQQASRFGCCGWKKK